MEFQMLVAEHHFHNVMDFQELMDTQVLIASLLHSQPVELISVDFQEEIALSEPAQHHQVLQLSSKETSKSQPAQIDTPLTVNQSAPKVKPPAALNQELQPPSQWTLGTIETDSKVPKPGITPLLTDLSE